MVAPGVNILFTGAGRRVELIRLFRAAYAELDLPGTIVAVDVDPLAPGLRAADRRYLVPPSRDDAYVPTLAGICRAEEVSLVIPLTDRDLPVLARRRGELEAAGARPLVLPETSVAAAADKLATHRMFVSCGVPAPRSWSREEARAGSLAFPVFVKPRYGSGGTQAVRADDERELSFFLDHVPDAMVQEFLPGPEITNDVFCDFEGTCLAVVSRRRIEVRWGEVAKGVTVREPFIADCCVKVSRALRATGPITVQCMLRDDRPYFTEVNARFAGGVPLAVAAGVPLPRWVLALASGRRVDPPPLGCYETGVFLTRFDDSYVLTEEDRDAIERRRL